MLKLSVLLFLSRYALQSKVVRHYDKKTVILAKRHLERRQRSARVQQPISPRSLVGLDVTPLCWRTPGFTFDSLDRLPHVGTFRVEEASVRRKGETLQSRFCDPRDALIFEYSRTWTLARAHAAQSRECFREITQRWYPSYYIRNAHLTVAVQGNSYCCSVWLSVWLI